MGNLEGISDYWNRRSDGYSDDITRTIDTGEAFRWSDLIEEQIGDGPLDVLDIGTGPGFFPIILGMKGHRVTGIDCSEGMLDKAQANCARYGVEADFRIMDAQNLDFGEGTFDLVISRNVVWNLEDPLKAYGQWLRVLRPGGKLMVFDGNHYLHLYDSDIKDDRCTNHPPIKDVDPNVMRDIARGLPLSRERRPQWDIDALIGLGASAISMRSLGKPYEIERDGAVTIQPFSFLVCAEKRWDRICMDNPSNICMRPDYRQFF